MEYGGITGGNDGNNEQKQHNGQCNHPMDLVIMRILSIFVNRYYGSVANILMQP